MTTATYAVQPCCREAHPTLTAAGGVWKHVRFYRDKNDRTRHVNECVGCLSTRAERGHVIRWAGRDGYCEVCRG